MTPGTLRDEMPTRVVLNQSIIVEQLRDAVVKVHHAATMKDLEAALQEVRRTAEWGLRIIRTG